MRVLCTGGAGYVGSACLRRLLAEGYEAVAYDNLSLGHKESLPDDRLIIGDISDTEALTDSLRALKADAVMHFAAATSVGESVDDPEHHYRNNVGGTLSLLNAMRAAGVERLLFSSTCATYGLSPTIPMCEDTPQDACSPYARTKLAVEWMIRDFSSAYGLGYCLLRYFNAAGAAMDGQHGEDHDPETHLIPLILQNALGQREELRVFGDDYATPDGTCIRDYVHIEDLAEAHLLALRETKPGGGDVFNVGTGKGNSVLEVIHACEAAISRNIPFQMVDRRPGDAPGLVADAQKIQSKLGWEPRYTDIGAIVDTAWRWHRAYPDGYQSKIEKLAAR